MQLEEIRKALRRLDRQATRQFPEIEYEHTLKINGDNEGEVSANSDSDVIFTFSNSRQLQRKLTRELDAKGIAKVGSVIEITQELFGVPQFPIGSKLLVIEVNADSLVAQGINADGHMEMTAVDEGEFNIL